MVLTKFTQKVFNKFPFDLLLGLRVVGFGGLKGANAHNQSGNGVDWAAAQKRECNVNLISFRFLLEERTGGKS